MATPNNSSEPALGSAEREPPRGMPVTVYPIVSLAPTLVQEFAWDYEEQAIDLPGEPTPFARKLSLAAKTDGDDVPAATVADGAATVAPERSPEDAKAQEQRQADGVPPNRWLLRSRVVPAGRLAIPVSYDPNRHVLLASEVEILAIGLAPVLAEFAADSWRKLCYHLINAQELQYAHPALCEIARTVALGGAMMGRPAALPCVVDREWLVNYLPCFPELDPLHTGAAEVYAPFFGFVAPVKDAEEEEEEGEEKKEKKENQDADDAPVPFVQDLRWFTSPSIKAAFVPSHENLSKWMNMIKAAGGLHHDVESMKAWQALAAVNTIRPRAELERMEGYFNDAIDASVALARLLAVVHMASKRGAIIRCADIATSPEVPVGAFGAENAPFAAGAERAVPAVLTDASWRAKTSSAFDAAEARRREIALALFRRAARAAIKTNLGGVLLDASVHAASKAESASPWTHAKEVLLGVWKARADAKDPSESLGKVEIFNCMGVMANSDVAVVRRLHAELACAQSQKAYCAGRISVFGLAGVLPDAVTARMLQESSHNFARAVYAATAALARVDHKSGTMDPMALEQLIAHATAVQRTLDTVADFAIIKGATATHHAMDVACVSLRKGELEAQRQHRDQFGALPASTDSELAQRYIALHASSVGAVFQPGLTEIVPRKIVLADERDRRTVLEQLAGAVSLQWHADSEKSMLGWFKWAENILRQKVPIGATGKTISVALALKSALDVPVLIDVLQNRRADSDAVGSSGPAE